MIYEDIALGLLLHFVAFAAQRFLLKLSARFDIQRGLMLASQRLQHLAMAQAGGHVEPARAVCNTEPTTPKTSATSLNCS